MARKAPHRQWDGAGAALLCVVLIFAPTASSIRTRPHLDGAETAQLGQRHHKLTARIRRAAQPMVGSFAGARLMRLRGAGETPAGDADAPAAAERDGAASAGGELFDALLEQRDHVAFLSEKFARGNAAVKEQCVGYTVLLMSEAGFLENMTPKQLLDLCITNPELVRASARALPDAELAADGGEEALQTLLAGLPEAVDALSLRALLSHTNSSITQDLVGLPANATVQDALHVLLDCPALWRWLMRGEVWHSERTEHTILGALLRRSPMEDLAYWDDVAGDIRVGDPLDAAMERASSEMQALQAAWEAHQDASAQLVRELLGSREKCSEGALGLEGAWEWFQHTLLAGRERTTEAARMQLLAHSVMPGCLQPLANPHPTSSDQPVANFQPIPSQLQANLLPALRQPA